MATDTSSRLIQSAQRLIASHGSHGTSFSDVLTASQGPRGSLYYHFPGGKEQLVAAAVSEAGENVIATLEALRGRPASEVAAMFLDMWRRLLTHTNFEVGCAVVAVTVDAESSTLVESAGAVFVAWANALSGLLVDGGIPAEQGDALATLLIASSEGAVIMARAQRDIQPFDLVAEQLKSVIGAHSR